MMVNRGDAETQSNTIKVSIRVNLVNVWNDFL